MEPLILKYKDPYDEVQIGLTKTGELQCSGSLVMSLSSCKGADWCIHMETAVKQGLDAQLIWEAGELSEEFDISVPMIPTLHQWAKVQLHLVEKLGAYKAYYQRESQDDNTPVDELTFIGFLHPGEGRRVLREMIGDWLELNKATLKIECVSVTHSFRAQMAWEHNTLESAKKANAEFWSVLDTGKCITCNQSGSGEDFSDLVPEASGGSRPTWR